MGKIIQFRKAAEKTIDDNLITLTPWEFRRAEWSSKYFVRMPKGEYYDLLAGGKRLATPPKNSELRDSVSNTIHSIYCCRENCEQMKEVYYLTGLIDCMINQTNPLLRTDSIKEMYKKIKTFKEILGISWYGRMDEVFIPVARQLFDLAEYRTGLSSAKTMKGLYSLIKQGTEEMFNILASHYLFFLPNEGAKGW